MDIISRFVREQHRYSKSDLCSIFSFKENSKEIDGFISNLKSYGILKTVASKDTKDKSDLIDEEILLQNGTDNCLFVFTFVGVITSGRRVIKIYPKYLQSYTEPQTDFENPVDPKLITQMKQVIKVIEKYKKSKKQDLILLSDNVQNRNFNILSVILYLLNDYFENGLYNNPKDILEINGEGEIVWGRTIDDAVAFIEDNRPYYPELITRKTDDDENDFFKRLHECVLTECSKKLRDSGLEDLFEIESVFLSEVSIDDFGDKEYILEKIMSELNVQYNTHLQITLKTLYSYISQEHKMLEDDDISLFGTNAFHAVWENVCSVVFENRLNETIHNVFGTSIKGYKSSTELIDIIDKPKWKVADSRKTRKAKDTLIPDLISITQCNGNNWFVIFDAKYYVLQLETNKELAGNPGVGDVTKQYLYQLAYNKLLKALPDSKKYSIQNCFLMPTEEKKIVVKGSVRMDMLKHLGLVDIQIRQIPAQHIYDCYLTGKKIPISDLKLKKRIQFCRTSCK